MKHPFPMQVAIMGLMLVTSSKSACATSVAELETSLRSSYAGIVYASYVDAQTAAKTLHDAIVSFVAKPSEAGLQACRTAWIKARRPYAMTEAFRFYGGPIDDASGGLEGQLNAWPVDESWMEDAAPGSKRGILKDTLNFPHINAQLLAGMNQVEGEKNICTGWHAIEFLLWGVDNNPNGPGQRPVSDFIEGELAGRRRDALLACGENLMVCLGKLVAAWEPAATSPAQYRAQFLTTDPHETAQRIFTGITLLVGGEMAGERMTVMLETRDQENEQSCFSDTTKQDIIFDLAGVKMVWEGKFESQVVADSEISGTGLRDVAKAWDPALTGVIDQAIAKAEKLCQALPNLMDQAIGAEDLAPERIAIVQARDALEYVNALFAALSGRMGVVLPTTPLDG